MAEELGHIDIRFPNVPGGGAGDSTGPLPTRVKVPDIGGQISTVIRAVSGDFTAMMKLAIDGIANTIAGTLEFVHDSVAKMREAGRFAPGVIQENIAMRLQTMQQSFQEARILGPLYSTVLRWYRELMALIQPWKLLFATIVSTLTGVLLSLLTAFMRFVNQGLEALLAAVETLLDYVANVATTLAQLQPGQLGDAFKTIGQMTMNPLASLAGVMSNEIESWFPQGTFGEMASQLGTLAGSARDTIRELRDINKKLTKPGGSLDWAGAQLRELASRSGLYNRNTVAPFPNPGFWNPPSSHGRYPSGPRRTP